MNIEQNRKIVYVLLTGHAYVYLPSIGYVKTQGLASANWPPSAVLRPFKMPG